MAKIVVEFVLNVVFIFDWSIKLSIKLTWYKCICITLVNTLVGFVSLVSEFWELITQNVPKEKNGGFKEECKGKNSTISM